MDVEFIGLISSPMLVMVDEVDAAVVEELAAAIEAVGGFSRGRQEIVPGSTQV